MPLRPVVAPPPPRYVLAATLLLATLVLTTTIGALWNESPFLSADSFLWASPAAIWRVWTDPALRALGLAYSLPLIFILLCHELGHYLACRYYRLPATLPYFLPLPLGLGTLGAFIRIRTVIRHKRELFDVGIAGPLAGFVALVPILLYGVAHSEVVDAASAAPGQDVLGLGGSLALFLAVDLLHGPLGPDQMLDLHPAALAAWVGLLATSLNLLPLGQLDGGHVLYAAVGRWQRALAIPLWLLLAATGLLWPGWWIWCVFVLLMGLYHPPVRDEILPLSPGRRWLALVALVLLVLCFMPVPLSVVSL